MLLNEGERRRLIYALMRIKCRAAVQAAVATLDAVPNVPSSTLHNLPYFDYKLPRSKAASLSVGASGIRNGTGPEPVRLDLLSVTVEK